MHDPRSNRAVVVNLQLIRCGSLGDAGSFEVELILFNRAAHLPCVPVHQLLQRLVLQYSEMRNIEMHNIIEICNFFSDRDCDRFLLCLSVPGCRCSC